MLELPPTTYQLVLPLEDRPLPNVEILSDTTIVMSSHLAAGVYAPNQLNVTSDNERQAGDAGRKARAIANRTGYPVLVTDRARFQFNGKPLSVTPENIAEVARHAGDDIERVMAATGLKYGILAGNSAGGTAEAFHTLALAESDTMSVSHLSVFDPVGLTRNSLPSGLIQYSRQAIRETFIKRPPRPEDDILEKAVGLNIKEFFADARAYHKLWESSATAAALERIASRLGNIAVRVEIPEITFTISDEAAQIFADDLMLRRYNLTLNDKTAKPLSASVSADTFHGLGENFPYIAGTIAKVIEPAFKGYRK